MIEANIISARQKDEPIASNEVGCEENRGGRELHIEKKVNNKSLRGLNNTVNTCEKMNKPNIKEMHIQLGVKQIKESDNGENKTTRLNIGKNTENRQYHSVDSQIITNELMLLKEGQRHLLGKLLENFRVLFSDKPGCAKGYEHQIKLTTERPRVHHNYPIPFALRDPTRKAIETMIKEGVIERGISQYCNPLRIVKKEDNSVRVCLDARFLNKVIEDDQESPPLINELMQKYYEAQWFSKIDLTHGYWQVSLEKSSRPLTAFLFESKTYQFCRIPFGLKTAGSGFMRALSYALKSDFEENISCYIDDILIGTKTFKDHLLVLKRLFQRLVEYNFTIRLSKCVFFQKKVSFLGFEVSMEGISPEKKKLENIINFKEPKNKKQLQQFLGVCNYYRQFNVRHSNSVDSLRELLKKDIIWKWTPVHSTAFQRLKEDLNEGITLKHIIPGGTFRLQTDASDRGIAGILYQINEEGNHNVIGLVSRCLSPAEIKYTTTEKELLAIVYSIEKFRVYLIGIHFEIVTDHQCLTFVQSASFRGGRIARWILLLQQYSFSVVYCRGVDNVVADFFSRNPRGEFAEERREQIVISSLHQCLLPAYDRKETSFTISMIHYDADFVQSVKTLSEGQRDDPRLKCSFDAYNEKGKDSRFVVYKDILFHREGKDKNWRIVIPAKMQPLVIDAIHNKLGHPGVYKTNAYLKQFYYWRGMSAQVKKHVLCCDLCQRVKYLTIPMEGEHNFIESSGPNDLITVDFYGPLPMARGGMQYIFVVLDAFTKYVSLYPMKKATVRMCIKKITEVFIPKFGKPKRILSDHGSQFTSALWKKQMETEGIKVVYSSIRHPQSNPTERVMRELGRLFRTLCAEKHTKWVHFVPKIEEILNITVHQSTEISPYELQYGLSVQDEIQKLIQFPTNKKPSHEYLITLARDNLKKHFQYRKKQEKKGAPKIELFVGDQVLVRVKHLSNAIDKVVGKFFHLFEGPYKIVRSVGKNAFAVADLKNEQIEKGIYNRCNLRKYNSIKEKELSKYK